MRTISFLTSVTLVVLCPIPYLSTASADIEQIASYQKKIMSHENNLLDMGKQLGNQLDEEIVFNLMDLADKYFFHCLHIQDLMLIDSLIQSPTDRERIKPIISRSIAIVRDGIDRSIKTINQAISHLKNQGVIVEATQLRDDLRGLKELLSSPS